MRLDQAYFEYAWAIAILHISFLVCWFTLRLIEYFRLRRESLAFYENGVRYDSSLRSFLTSSEATGSEPIEDNDTEVGAIAWLVCSMARKGELLDTDRIKNRLARSYGRYDSVVRTCINGFVVSGLLGTLYNLWKLGPSFWNAIITGGVDASKPAIGVAFSSSIIGLSLALAVSVIDSWVILGRRESLIRHLSNSLSARAVSMLPPRESAAIAHALMNFYDASRGFLEKIRVSHEEFSANFIKQISDSSDRLDNTLTSVSTEWKTLTQDATSTLQQSSGSLKEQCKLLTDAIGESAQLIDRANKISREAETLTAVLLQIRSEATAQTVQLNAKTEELTEKWINDLTRISDSYFVKLNDSYERLWSSYTQQDIAWRQQNSETLDRFADRIEGNIREWGKERDALSAYVQTMITEWKASIDKSVETVSVGFKSIDVSQKDMLREWREQLGTSITDVQAGLAELTNQVDRLKAMPSELQGVYDTSAQQLGSLGNAITMITSRIAEGSPVSETVKTLRDAVIEFQTLVRENGRNHWLNPKSPKPTGSPLRSEIADFMTGIMTSNSRLHDDLASIQVLLERFSSPENRRRGTRKRPLPNGGGQREWALRELSLITRLLSRLRRLLGVR
jgi:hypothetical protein